MFSLSPVSPLLALGSPLRRLLAAGMVLLACGLAAAYVPGTGPVYSDDFEGELDPDWEQESGLFTATSPWSQVPDGGDTSFNADGRGPIAGSPTRHWARHFVHPVAATTFSLAMEYRAELGADYLFDLELEQRAPVLRKYRLRIDGEGRLSLWRTESGQWAQMTSTGPGAVTVNQKTWIRLAIEPDAGGHRWLRARLWQGGAEAEPSSWTLEAYDELDVIERVHRFELIADGPANVETWIDDLDLFGDMGSGVDSSVRKIYIMELSHLDIGFTKPPDDIALFAKTHLDQVLDNLDADPDYRWTIENGWWLDRWWEQSTPAEQQRMADHLREGRIVLAAGYANLHTTKTGQEELARTVYFSSRMGREEGFPVRTFVEDDVPGASFAIPEILARSGMDFYVGGMNASFGGKLTEPDHGDRPFWWVGPDGSRVLAWITFDSYAEGLSWGFSFFDTLADLYDKMAKKLPEQEGAGYPYPEMLLMRGFDNHYQGFHTRDLANEWNATYETPKFVLSTAEEFLDHMLATYGAEAFPSYSGDFGAAWSGSNAGPQHVQTWVRQAHRDGRDGEALIAAAQALDGGSAENAERELLYRKMLESDEHSGSGGWPGYFTPEEMDRNNRQHLAFARDAKDAAEALVGEGLDRLTADLPASGDAIAVVNGLGRERVGWVRAALPSALYASSLRLVDRVSGVEIPYQRFDATEEILFRAEAVPSMGYKVYDLLPGEPTAEPQGLLSAGSDFLENDFYRLEVGTTDGSVTSLYDKTRGREMIDTAAGYRFNELAHNTHQETTAGSPPHAEPPGSAQVSLELEGPLVAAIKVTRTGSPHIESTYRLYLGEDRIEIENVFDRDKMHYVLESEHSWKYFVTMPFDIHDFQIRSETTTRFLDPLADGFARDSVFNWHNAEHTLAFWDDNFGVYNAVDSVSAFHFEHLTGLGAATFSTGDALLLPRMKDKADEYEFEDGHVGPFEEEPDTSPLYRYTHHLRSTDPGFDPTAASAFGFDALTPLRYKVLSRGPGNMPDGRSSAFWVDAPGVLLYTAKPAEDGRGVVLRMTELTGVETTLRAGSDLLTVTGGERLEEDEEGGTPLSLSGNAVELTLAPYETATVRLETTLSWAPVTLTVHKNASGGTIDLDWSGGVSPFTLRRAENPDFSDGQTLIDEQEVTSYQDPVLDDGRNYFYLVK